MMTMTTPPKAAWRAAGGRPPVDRRVHGRRVSAVTFFLNDDHDDDEGDINDNHDDDDN